jgi:hypothetical protein
MKTSRFPFGVPVGCMRRTLIILLCATFGAPVGYLCTLFVGGLVVNILHISGHSAVLVAEIVGIAMGLILGSVYTDWLLRRTRKKLRGW